MFFPFREEGGIESVQSADSGSGSLGIAGEYTLMLYRVRVGYALRE